MAAPALLFSHGRILQRSAFRRARPAAPGCPVRGGPSDVSGSGRLKLLPPPDDNLSVVLTQQTAAAELTTGVAGPILAHWPSALPAAGAGVLLALAYLAADYLILPALRLRAARRRGPEAVSGLLDRERRRLSRLRDTASVFEEHNHPDAAALREEAELRALVVEMMERARDRR